MAMAKKGATAKKEIYSEEPSGNITWYWKDRSSIALNDDIPKPFQPYKKVNIFAKAKL